MNEPLVDSVHRGNGWAIDIGLSNSRWFGVFMRSISRWPNPRPYSKQHKANRLIGVDFESD